MVDMETEPSASNAPAVEPPKGPTKRKALSDVTEAADKKSKTERPTNPTEDMKRASKPGGIIHALSSRFSTPVPCSTDSRVTFNSACMHDIFDCMRDAILNMIYPDGRYEPDFIISQDDWRLCCRYFVKARVDTVYGTCLGVRPANRIAIPREFELPKALTDLINGIGRVSILGNAFSVYPEPEGAPAVQANALHTAVTPDMLRKFSSLISAAKVRNLISTGYISSVPEGNAWWLLSPRSPANASNASSNDDHTQVFAVFKEWTPADMMYAALVQRGYDGQCIPHPATFEHVRAAGQAAIAVPHPGTILMWTADIVSGILGARITYCLEA